MSEKKIPKLKIAASLILAVAIFLIIVMMSNKLEKQKAQINVYDMYANTIEDYSFILGCRNTVKCQIEKSDDYSRKYVYNTHYDGNDRVIFQFGLFQDSYQYEKQELFKGINAVKPFPEASLPHYINTHTEFRHYLSKSESDFIFDPDNPHEQIALSFNRAISYKELMDYQTHLDDLGYAVKFCWVDIYLLNEITESSKYAMGRPIPKTCDGYEKYVDYNTAYGFLLYDHDYPNNTTFDEPAQRFIDIISTRYDDNFMSEELNKIKENLSQKGTLSVDSLEIIGVVLEKKDGRQFSEDEARAIYDEFRVVSVVMS